MHVPCSLASVRQRNSTHTSRLGKSTQHTSRDAVFGAVLFVAMVMMMVMARGMEGGDEDRNDLDNAKSKT